MAYIVKKLPMARERHVKDAWNTMCKKLHKQLKCDIPKKVHAYKDLSADFPALLTLAAFKSNVQGGARM